MRPALILIPFIVAACGPSTVAPPVGQRSQQIIGGTLDTGDPAVVSLALYSYGTFHHSCTGTLIAPQTILTAAHCVMPDTYYAIFGNETAHPDRIVEVVQQVRHPNYDSATISNDVAVFKLAYPVPVAPIPINDTPLGSSWLGQPLRQVGFGLDAIGGNSGVKREVTHTILDVTVQNLRVGADGKQNCYGDSGGPGFIILPGESFERVAGTSSYGVGNSCNITSYDARVDVFADSFITPTMHQWEQPSCAADWGCVPGCMPVDIDCLCAPDGACSAQCTSPERDPDCPTDCALNHVCHPGCPLPDPDCKLEGQTCSVDTDCLSGTCVSDAQTALPYCSKACTTHADCIDQMECQSQRCVFKQRPVANVGEPCTLDTYCLLGSLCAGPADAERKCAMPCGTSACDYGSSQCLVGDRGELYCDPAQANAPEDAGTTAPTPTGPAVPQPADATPAPKSGCAATASSPEWTLWVIALGLMVRRGRRFSLWCWANRHDS